MNASTIINVNNLTSSASRLETEACNLIMEACTQQDEQAVGMQAESELLPVLTSKTHDKTSIAVLAQMVNLAAEGKLSKLTRAFDTVSGALPETSEDWTKRTRQVIADVKHLLAVKARWTFALKAA